MSRWRATVAGLVAAATLAACGAGGSPIVEAAEPTSSTVTTSTTTTTTTASTTLPPVTEPPTTGVPEPAPVETVVTEAPRPGPRTITEQAWVPFALVEGLVLRHPSSRVERVGFHESNHDGARQMEAVDTAVDPATMETRDRGTGSQTAADIVVDPTLEIRAPVTGTVLRASGYTLYCHHRDEYAVIEPDDHPGWEVKVLHIVGLQVGAGDRVVAGETVIALEPHQLPFGSQVDERRSADPAWPHVHIEVVDPSIPDRPTPGGGC